MRIRAIGYGAGARDPGDFPNVVRVVLGDDTAAGAEEGSGQDRLLSVLEANLDDLTPELSADAAAALMAAGAMDVWITPTLMKKGRPGVTVSTLCRVEDEASVRLAFFDSTSTFGVRGYSVRRSELERGVETVALRDGSVRVKVGRLDGRVLSVKPEHDEVAALAARTGRSVRAVHEEAVAAARFLLNGEDR
jgi:uncharacterized protein (DUF111 family)